MAYLIIDEDNFKHMHRVLNTNIDGRQKVAYSLTAIKGVGRRFAHVVCRKAGIDLRKRAGDLTEDELEEIKARIEMPLQHDIPVWMLNRRKDRESGDNLHHVSSDVDTALRNDIERMKKIRLHRGLRHYWNLRVRGQHTCSTGRHRKSATSMAKAGTLPK